MADRYWVGGTAAWDDTAGTKWAATSGGPGGETVPTTADDVFFDASSTGTVTIASTNTGAKSVNCTGFTGTFAGSTVNLTIAGSLTLVAGMGYTYIGNYTFTGTGTLITAGKTVRDVTINPGVGNTVTLGDAFSAISTSAIAVTNGTFDTANYTVTTGRLSTNSANSTVNLGSSTVTLNSTSTLGINSSSTFNAGTSQINITVGSTASSLSLGGKTYYNVSFTNSTRGEILMGTTGAIFNNLSFVGPTSSGVQIVTLGANITVNGTLTAAGPTVLRRMFIRSSDPATITTITAASVSADNCDFESITIAGAASPIAPTRAGDCGGNSGITFPAAKTVYRVGTNTTWAGSLSWALTSGGPGGDNNFPLPQDTAIINDDTTLTGTLGLTAYNIGTFDCSTRTTGITINYNAVARWHGSHTLSSAITVSGTNTQTFAGRTAIDFTSAGKTITFIVTVANPTGTFRLMDALNGSTSSCAINVNNGTFDANDYNVTCFQFGSSGTALRTVTMGSGLWTIGGTSVLWNTGTTINLTFNKGTADILLSNTTTTSRIFTAGALSFNKLTIGGATGTSVTTLGQGTGASFTELASTKTVSHTIRFSANVATIGVWSVTGTAGNVVTVDSNTAGSRRSFTLSNITSGIDYLSVKDIGELSGNKFYVGVNSTDGGNNSNVYFTDTPSLDGGIPFLLFFS